MSTETAIVGIDTGTIIVEIRAAEGGADAWDLVTTLGGIYLRRAGARGL